MRPFASASVRTRSRKSGAGSFVERSRTNSVATMRPRPRTSPISSWCAWSSRSRASRCVPCVRAFSSKRSFSITSIVASAAATAATFPPKVFECEPWVVKSSSDGNVTAPSGNPPPSAFADVPEPVPGSGEITVRLAACGICGTDLEKLRGNYRTAGILGHEPVGRVARVGAGVAGFAEGDRVFVHHHVPCYACPVCSRGDLTFCPEYSRSNLDPGGFAEVFRVPAANVARGAVLPLDPTVEWGSGALLEPAGCALTALRRVAPPDGASYVILGLGPIGLLYARVARALGASWIGGTDLSPKRRDAARQGGVDEALDPREDGGLRGAVDRATHGVGVDVAVVATGDPTCVPHRLQNRAPPESGLPQTVQYAEVPLTAGLSGRAASPGQEAFAEGHRRSCRRAS